MKTLSKVIEKDDNEALARWTSMGPVSVQNGRVVPATPKPNLEEEAKKRFEDAYQEGFEKGLQEGRAKGQQEISANAQKLMQIATALGKPYAEIDEAAEAEFINLALALAKQVIRKELQTQPEAIASIVHQALSTLSNVTSDVIVTVNPEDAAILKEEDQNFSELGSVKFKEDATIARGGCRVQSSASRVDATIEKQFEQLTQQLTGQLDEE